MMQAERTARRRVRAMGSTESGTDGLLLTFLLEREEGEWVGLCLELNIAASGDSAEEVVEVLRDLVELYTAGCAELGDLPVPMRPVPPATVLGFLAPPGGVAEANIISHREAIAIHAAA
jgi:predicted RNase H-like HicB family nuclease